MTQTQNMIRFELVAPYNPEVKLLGSWNQWTPIDMQRQDDGTWCVDVPLPDGEHQYKFQTISQSYFALGNTVSVSDPRAAEYTLDSRENSLLRVKNGQRVTHEYTWQHDDVPLPQNDQLVIYELHVGDFRGGAGDTQDARGTFATVIDKLDYLADLGINAIELMPINEFPGDYSWGYAQRSIYAIENSYGKPDELCRLVDECHARGIRVIHDAVYNHLEAEAPLTQIDYQYWFYETSPDSPDLSFGPKFNYEKWDDNLKKFPAREHVWGAMNFMLTMFHIDGIRFDCTRALRYFELLQWFHDEAHKQADFKPFYTIAEHIPQDPAIAGTDGPMDAAWHDNYYRQINSTVLGIPMDGRNPFDTTGLLRVLDGRGDGFEGSMNTIHYTENHDQERGFFALGDKAKIFGDAAFRRARLGAALLLTSPGVPMLWMGQEFGQATPKTMEPQPLQWGLLENEANRALHEFYKHMIHVRLGNPALTGHQYQTILDLPERGILAFKRWNAQGNVVVVVANLKDEFGGEFEIANAALEDGEWREVVYGYDIQLTGGTLKDKLAQSDVKVYIKR